MSEEVMIGTDIGSPDYEETPLWCEEHGNRPDTEAIHVFDSLRCAFLKGTSEGYLMVKCALPVQVLPTVYGCPLDNDIGTPLE